MITKLIVSPLITRPFTRDYSTKYPLVTRYRVCIRVIATDIIKTYQSDHPEIVTSLIRVPTVIFIPTDDLKPVGSLLLIKDMIHPNRDTTSAMPFDLWRTDKGFELFNYSRSKTNLKKRMTANIFCSHRIQKRIEIYGYLFSPEYINHITPDIG